MNKVLVIGLDGATFDLICPWVVEGKLPHLAQFMREGAWGELRSVLPPLTAPAWVTMMTGRNPGKHRIGDFRQRDFAGYGFRLLNASARVGPCIWDLVSDTGGRVAVINVPMTYPPTPVNGIMISGRDTPGLGASYTYPPGLKYELRQAIGDYVIVPEDWLYMRRGDPARAHYENLRELDCRLQATRYLLKRYQPDLTITVFSATDGAAHFFSRYHYPNHPLYDPPEAARFGDAILEIYQRADQALGALLAEVGGETTIFVVSDHGNGPLSDRGIFLNAWLEAEGLLQYHRPSTTKPGLRRTLSEALAQALQFGRDEMSRRMSYGTRIGIQKLAPSWLRRAEDEIISQSVDWGRTRAFSEEIRGHIWINLRERDPKGIVEPGAEYEALREHIIAAVSELRDPRTGEKIIRRAYRREELYHGPYTDRFPDIILEPNDTILVFRRHTPGSSNQAVRLLDRSEVAMEGVSGSHLMNGILLAQGPGIRAGTHVEGARIEDVTPTVLYAAGIAATEDMDGRVLTDLFDRSYMNAHPPPRPRVARDQVTDAEEGYSKEEAREVEERLRGLGYL